MGLDEARYSNVCTNIIGMDILPDLNSIYQRVVREEKRLGASRSESKETQVGFVTKTVSREGEEAGIGGVMATVARRRSSVVCNNCGRTGHKKKKCWQIIGFPERYTKRNQSSGRGGRGGRGRGRANSPRANAVPRLRDHPGTRAHLYHCLLPINGRP